VPVSERGVLEESVMAYTVTRAAEQLWRQASTVSMVAVFLLTNRFHENEEQYHASRAIARDEVADDTRCLITAAVGALLQIYESGFRYHKTG